MKLGKRLKVTKREMATYPKDPVEHVKHMCNTPQVTWAACLALYGEQEKALEIT